MNDIPTIYGDGTAAEFGFDAKKPLDISTSSSEIRVPKCTRWNRCNRTGCIHCDTRNGLKKVPEIIHNLESKGSKLYHLTLTLKSDSTPNHTSLKSCLDWLYMAFRKLREHRFWTDHIQGGLYRLHVDYPRHWHPHFHILLEATPFNQSDISKAWKKASGGSFIVHLRHAIDTDLDRLKLTNYICKAPQKHIAHDPDLMIEFRKAIRGRRKMQRFGTWTNTRYTPDRWKKLSGHKAPGEGLPHMESPFAAPLLAATGTKPDCRPSMETKCSVGTLHYQMDWFDRPLRSLMQVSAATPMPDVQRLR